MESAQYGRMELGRCLLRDYGYVGCGVSVLPYVDSRCSGRRSCNINIPDPVLDKVQPCPGDLKSYLQASYTCIKGRPFILHSNPDVCDFDRFASRKTTFLIPHLRSEVCQREIHFPLEMLWQQNLAHAQKRNITILRFCFSKSEIASSFFINPSN